MAQLVSAWNRVHVFEVRKNVFSYKTNSIEGRSLWMTTNTELKNHTMVTPPAINQLSFVQILRVLKLPLFPMMTQPVCTGNWVHVFEEPEKSFSVKRQTLLRDSLG